MDNELTYHIENRQNRKIIVTNQYFNKQQIIMEVDVIIKSCKALVSEALITETDVYWVLGYDDEKDSFYMSVNAGNNRCELEVDIKRLLKETIDCIRNNLLLNKCEYLNSLIIETYQLLFDEYLQKDIQIFSDIPVKCYTVVKSNNQTLGYASRAILDLNDITILEYTGKKILAENNYSCAVDIMILVNNKKTVYTNLIIKDSYHNEQDIGAYTFKSKIASTFTDLNSNDNQYVQKDFSYLNVSNTLTSLSLMVRYVSDNNPFETIIKYKKDIKPEIKLININKAIVKEYLV